MVVLVSLGRCRAHPQHFRTIRFQFLCAHAADALQVVQRSDGAALGNGCQRGIVEDDVGGQVVFAGHFGAPGLEVDEAHLRVGPQVGGGGGWWGAALCVRLGAAAETDSRSCTGTSPLSTAREPSVRHSVSKLMPLSSITFAKPTAPVAISWRSTPRSLRLGQVCANAEGGELVVPELCHLLSVFLPRRCP